MTSRSETISRTTVVILAAGKGTRMGSEDTPKVCFDIGGQVAINRQITAFKGLGFGRFLVVLGSLAETAMETINSEHRGLMYAFQNPQQGTGDAARVACDSLQAARCDDNVLLTMGDKLIDPAAIEMLVGVFAEQQPDMALLTVPKTPATFEACGRVFVDDSGDVIDIIERPDIARQAVADSLRAMLGAGRPVTGKDIEAAAEEQFESHKKRTAAVGELLELARNEIVDAAELRAILERPSYNIEVAGRRYSAQEIENRCETVNPSLYMFEARAFRQGIGMIDNNNAQGEYYLTDVVRHLASIRSDEGSRRYRIVHAPIERGDWIQGFNNIDELEAIREYVRRWKRGDENESAQMDRASLRPGCLRPVSQWINAIESSSGDVEGWLDRIYGPDESLRTRKKNALLEVLRCYAKAYGADEKVCIVRAPGRVNIMGRHVDHRGAYNNFLAIDRETIAVAGLRNDELVTGVNTDPDSFERFEFNINEILDRFAESRWIDFVNSDHVKSMLEKWPGHWSNYIKAAFVRLKHNFPERSIRGLNMAVTGDVPIAAGLSSSSTLVVASMQAAASLNELHLTSRQFVELCGQGEWFVGSRGGSGDHAAIRLSSRAKITKVGYHPFRVEKTIDMPHDYRLVIADSGVSASKSLPSGVSAAKNTFNARIASYDLGLELLKSICGRFADRLRHIRDLDPARLGCSVVDVYRMLRSVPREVTRQQFQQALGETCGDLLRRSFASHDDPGSYIVRGVLLFGAAETVRSRMCTDYLEKGQVERFGRLMKISHDGDRVARDDGSGRYVEIARNCDDAYFDGLIADLASDDTDKVLAAQPSMQPGAYACSIERIDRMVDIACSVEGVVGAQIAGAGLGGCIMILAHESGVEAVGQALIGRYYEPQRIEPRIMPCVTVEGAALVEF